MHRIPEPVNIQYAVSRMEDRVREYEKEFDSVMNNTEATVAEILNASHQMISRIQVLRYFESLAE